MKSSILATSVALALTAPSFGQSPVVGVDIRGTDSVFSSTTSSFVSDFVAGPDVAGASSIFALDLDAAATTLWAIDTATKNYGTIDLNTGAFNVVGVSNITGPLVTGLTAHPNGVDWYATVINLTGGTDLLIGDVTTGLFTIVGEIVPSQFIIDIACSSTGDIHVLSITDDSLYSVDATTGAGTLVGPHGLPANFGQGMDWDWSTDTLYAAIYTGSGTGMFCSLDITTGAILTMEDTVSLDAEIEMAVQVPSQNFSLGVNYCGPAVVNASGSSAVIQAVGSISAADNDVTLRASSLPLNAFSFFLTSQTQDLIMQPGGSLGTLCLGGSIGRYVGPGQTQNSGSSGSISLVLDLTNHPQPTTSVSVMAGEVWNFQAWFRDTDMGTATSNFTDAVSVTFN